MNDLENRYYSKDEFCKICHIGKATASWLIEENLVFAIDTHKATNRYLIPSDEIKKYLLEREKFPEKYRYHFHADDPSIPYNAEKAKLLYDILEKEWRTESDVLTTKDVSRLLGYQQVTIANWCKKKKINALYVSGKHKIPKICLLNFIKSPIFHNIFPKSEIHMGFLRRICHETKYDFICDQQQGWSREDHNSAEPRSSNGSNREADTADRQ